MLSLPTLHVLSQRLIPLVVAAFLSLYPLQAAITAGGLAVIGFTDDSTEDDFVLVVTENIAAGQTVYFTNTGWTNNGSFSDFYGVNNTSESGDQQLMRLTINQALAPGTLISTLDTSNAAFTWKTSGSITGMIDSASYSKLNLLEDGGVSLGDQIYVFQSTDASNPMDVSPASLSFIYLLDNGEPGSLFSGFQPASGYPFDQHGGDYPYPSNVAQGLSLLDNTAVELRNGTHPDGFHTGSFGLKMSASEILALQTNGGTKAEWLAAIANPDNWKDNPLPTTGLNFVGVPEPSRVVLIMGAFGVIILRRRRRPWR